MYVFRNRFGEVIYVGKAKSLRKRMAAYFQPSRRTTADPKLRALIHSIEDYETITVRSEAEALLLESRLIKQYTPRYNVDWRDDKRYLLIALDPNEPFPRFTLTRLRKDDGRLYFGPFPHARAVRLTIDWLSKHFRLRTCKVRNPGPEDRLHCMNARVRHCLCPCSGAVDQTRYRRQVEAALDVLRGKTREVEEVVRAEMMAMAEKQQYEQAARLRDVIANLKAICDPTRRSFVRTTLSRTDEGPGRVTALQEALGLDTAPAVIECVDISNIGGRMAVGSLVCFRDGRPSTRDYRRYRIRTVEGSDDFAMMAEIMKRRYGPDRQEKDRAFPDLVVVDGGLGQLHAAAAALAAVDAAHLPIASIAKRFETLFLAGRDDGILLPRHHAGLKLVQALRDEAHRFAINYHRTLRARRISASMLDDVEGVGPKRKEQILRAFRSITRLRKATAEEIAAKVPGIGHATAERILAALHKQGNRT